MQEDPLWNMANELRDVLPLSALREAEGWELVSHMAIQRADSGEDAGDKFGGLENLVGMSPPTRGDDHTSGIIQPSLIRACSQ